MRLICASLCHWVASHKQDFLLWKAPACLCVWALLSQTMEAQSERLDSGLATWHHAVVHHTISLKFPQSSWSSKALHCSALKTYDSYDPVMTLLRCKPIIDFSIVKGVTTMSLFDIVFPFLSGALSSMASPRFAQGKLKKLHVNIIGNKLNKPACPHCSMLRLRSRTFQHLDVLSLKQELSRIIRMCGFPKRSAVLSASWFLISATLLLLNRCINAHNTRHYFSSSFISPCLRQFHSFRNISHELICSTVFFEVETAPNPLAGVAVVQPGLESKNNIKQIHAKGRRLLNTPGS